MFEVVVDRAFLNYSIQKNIQFNIGKISFNYIWNNKEKKHNLGHPFLIFKLCSKAWVKLEKAEEMLPPQREFITRDDL